MESCEECPAESEHRQLDAMPAVNEIIVNGVSESARVGITDRMRVICSLWCRSIHPPGDLQQPSAKINKSTVKTLGHALRAVRAKVNEHHSNPECLRAAEAARAAADGPTNRPPSDAFTRMFEAKRAEQAATSAETALKAAQAREAELRTQLSAAEAATASLRAAAVDADGALPEAKRRRKAPLPWQQETAGWTVHDWEHWMEGEQMRRAVPIDEAADELPPHRGADGWLHHWSRGLLGAVKSWARGCRKHVVSMISTLISAEHGFGIEDESFEKWVDTEGDASRQDIINSTELRASSSTPFENGLHYLRWCVSKLFSQHSSRQQCRDVQAAKRPCRRWLRQCQSQTMQCGTCLP